MIYKTRAEAEAAGYFFNDSQGTPLDIGTEIQLVKGLGSKWSIGTKGKVVCFMNDSYGIGLDFGIPNSEYSQTIEGVARYCGRFLSDSFIECLVKYEEDDEKIISALRKSLEGPGQVYLNGSYYVLTPTANQKANDLVLPLLNAAAERIKTVRRQASQAIKNAEAKAANVLAMPTVTKDNIRKGLVLFKDVANEYIYYIMPFKFRPKFIAAGRTTAKTVISEEYQAKGAKDCFLRIGVDRNGYVQSGYLYHDVSCDSEFSFYNNGCIGTLSGSYVKSGTEALKFRDSYEELCKTLNENDIVRKEPYGLPTFSEMIKNSTAIMTTETVWTTKPMPKKGEPVLSCLVKVEKISDGMSLIGAVGKVVYQDLPNKFVSVEFLFPFTGGHDGHGLGEKGRCWDFFYTDLDVLTDSGVGRTRKIPNEFNYTPVSSAPTTVVTEWTTATKPTTTTTSDWRTPKVGGLCIIINLVSDYSSFTKGDLCKLEYIGSSSSSLRRQSDNRVQNISNSDYILIDTRKNFIDLPASTTPTSAPTMERRDFREGDRVIYATQSTQYGVYVEIGSIGTVLQNRDSSHVSVMFDSCKEQVVPPENLELCPVVTEPTISTTAFVRKFTLGQNVSFRRDDAQIYGVGLISELCDQPNDGEFCYVIDGIHVKESCLTLYTPEEVTA